MAETTYLNRLLPGFQAIGFSQKLNDMLRAQNVAAVRAHLPVLTAQLRAEGVGLTVNPLAPDLPGTWNALCDELETDPAITLPDYATYKVTSVDDFGVQWRQLCVALDREEGLSHTYTQYLGEACVPIAYQ